MNSGAYPRDCPAEGCQYTAERPSSFDLHVHRAHSGDEADRAVAGAIVDEVTSQ